ncbi:DUF6786 family protein [Zobellia barbeyronii]|uniref:Uncharacterized protein n=1 Tax=Zobellia barbeyronii TaxID=2748009 RepID=A0ABS5WDE0_9FLAO|nr:DUF6786 family protein [Zobellia barbeyronii]MBT2161382.1 hypothetical protein [Zobellia barbeyronii]
MTNYLKLVFCTGLLFAFGANLQAQNTFGEDLNFLKKHQEVITLNANQGKSLLIVSPALQGRVMTSTSNGLKGNSYGWMHYDLLASGKFEKHINPFGGEDRFWIGPEGGQYSIFFKKGTEFSFENWFTPKELDTESFDVIAKNESTVTFQKKMNLVNYQDFKFDIEVNRKVSIFNQKEIEKELNIDLKQIDFVGYQSENEIVNMGTQAWSKDTGLLSIWILGMFIPSENTTVILPYNNKLALNSSYFGTVPPERLTITDKHVLYKGNGTYRFKLGLPPQNIIPYIGSYDSKKNILTIVKYSFKGDTTYVNSVWAEQEHPYKGDVVNSYNDGPLENGDQLGPFYELESSSSTRELKPKEAIQHLQKTYHFEGDKAALNRISKHILNIDLNEL